MEGDWRNHWKHHKSTFENRAPKGESLGIIMLCNSAHNLNDLVFVFSFFQGITNACFKQLPGPEQRAAFGDIREYLFRNRTLIGDLLSAVSA